ncbi:MAG: DUF2865 domain-containing protein [Hyphomicrobiales bacterium]|nr:DUF2865 domain-containing protein [Hyphomicrobiales bacterium]
MGAGNCGEAKKLKDRAKYLYVVPICCALALLGVLGTLPGYAQSAACINLQNQLSNANFWQNRRVAPNSSFRQYDRAAKDQRVQIEKTQRMARRNSCSGNVYTTRNTSICGRILTSLNHMRNNLVSLERERRVLAPKNANVTNDRQRSIIRAMNRRGCFSKNNRRQVTVLQPRRRSLIEQIFGVRTFRNDGRRGLFEGPDSSITSRYNTYRTMCVRELDGYYFPISFSTTPERFEFDERICESQCPGTNVSLYYHAMPAQDSEDMISFRGQLPYADLPAAFAYRKEFNPKATCKHTTGFLKEVAGFDNPNQHPNNLSGANSIRISQPVFRRDRSLDPETIANQDGKFDKRDIVHLFTSPEDLAKAHVIALNGRKIRVVGPRFFNDAQTSKLE